MNDIIPWDKAIGRKVKSSDDKDLGRVQSITHDYIQTKEGMVSKNYYFIPKYYLTGYDGDNLWVSLTKDEVRSRFEKEKEPDLAELETPEYKPRRTEVMQQYPEFASNIPVGMVQMPWDKIIGKKVRSSDKKDLGDVESISRDYIEVKEGMLSKKHYFIPKYYIRGYDGDNLYTSLTKNEVKDHFERDSPPSPSEFQTDTYRQQMLGVEANYPQFAHGVPWMATKEPSAEIPVDYSDTTYKIPWDQLIHKHVRTTDNIEVGYVERIGDEFVVVREGVSDAHIYYVPKAYIRDYDGSQLWIDAPSGLVRSKFERESEPGIEEIRALAKDAPRLKRATKPDPPRIEPDSVTVQTKVDLEETSRPRTTEGS